MSSHSWWQRRRIAPVPNLLRLHHFRLRFLVVSSLVVARLLIVVIFFVGGLLCWTWMVDGNSGLLTLVLPFGLRVIMMLLCFIMVLIETLAAPWLMLLGLCRDSLLVVSYSTIGHQEIFCLLDANHCHLGRFKMDLPSTNSWSSSSASSSPWPQPKTAAPDAPAHHPARSC